MRIFLPNANFVTHWTVFFSLILNVGLLLSMATVNASTNAALSTRLRRQSVSERSSILTVEWEGIHTRVASDAIGGFQVEYRPEAEDRWLQHDGTIPYKGPDFQYRVRIKDLPSGVVYLVRINVLDRSGRVITSTPPIRANEDNVVVKCEGEPTVPRNVRVEATSLHSLTFTWEAPECGDVVHYVYRLEGHDEWATFDLREAKTEESSVTVRDLLPGSSYSFKLKAIDSNGNVGPWSDEFVRSSTDGSAPAVSQEIRALYKTDRQIRIEWEPYPHPRLQHYELVLTTRGPSGTVHLLRPQVPADQNYYVFSDLLPNTHYSIGVVAVADGSARQIYLLQATTARSGARQWSTAPNVSRRNQNRFQIGWDLPPDLEERGATSFVIEQRYPNETTWRTYGKTINYRPGKTHYSADVEAAGGRSNMFRVYLVNEQGDVTAVTDEFNVGGTGSDLSCSGLAGVPLDIHPLFLGPGSITYMWKPPSCDESIGPVEGYEYKFWNSGVQTEPERPLYTTEPKVVFTNLAHDGDFSFKVRSRSRTGPSTWSETLSGTTRPVKDPDPTDRPHNLRVVLAPPTSYLAWQPPRDRGHVTRYRLRLGKALKPSAFARVIDEPADRFRCPPGIGSPGDFCYELSGLEFGLQYNANVAAKLDSGAWTSDQNLHFVLVEALEVQYPGPSGIPAVPRRLRVNFLTPRRANVSWDFPLVQLTECDEYRLVVEVLDTNQPHLPIGTRYTHIIPGHINYKIIDDLAPSTTYNVSLQAGFNGNYGPAIWEVIRTQDIAPEIKTPRVTQSGGRVNVNWEVSGDLRNLCCYQVDTQRYGEQSWQTQGPLVHQRGDQNQYQTDLELQPNTEYYLRVRGLTPDRETLCTSPNVRIQTQCTAPTLPPLNLQGTAPDSRSVLLTWRPPDQSSWGCSEIYYIVEGTMNGQPQRFQVRPELRGYTVEYRIPSEPGAEWRLRVQPANTGGVGPWSNEVVINVESEAYVSTPRLTPQGAQIGVDWQSQGRGAGKVIGYFVEYRSSSQPVWQRHGSIIPYRGDNQPYSSSISGVQVGQTYYVRIQVMDQSNRVIYTSPEASTQTTCSAPTEPPSNLQLTTPDPRHVRVTWQIPPAQTWNCDDIQFEVEVIEPRGIQTSVLRRNQQQHVFTASPNQLWRVRVRTINNFGTSPWSREITGTTPPPGELIEGLQVLYQQEIPILTWRSVHGVDDLVSGYTVEYRTDAEPHWMPHSSGRIPYVGSQRPYEVNLGDLPEGQIIWVQVNVIDRSNGLAYTSPPLQVRTPTRCRPPTTVPDGVQVGSYSPDQIRLLWRPIPRPQWNCDNMWYIVKYSTANAFGVQTGQGFKNVSASESIATFDAQPSTRWTFQIQAANPAGAGPWSPEYTGETQSSIPGPVKDVVVVPVSPDTVRVTWRPPDDPNGLITGYEVTYQLLSRGLCSEAPEREITVLTQTPAYVIQNLVPHSRYKISVAAKTTAVGTRVSKDVTTEQAVPTAPPQAVQARSDEPNSASISWQAPPCEETNGEIIKYEYSVEGVEPWALSETRQASTPDVRAVVDALTPHTRYRVRVRAYTTRGPGPWSPEVFFTTRGSDQAPAPPYVKVTDTTVDSIGLVWQSPYPPHGQIDSYKVQFTRSGTGQWKEEVFRVEELRCSGDVQRVHQPQIARGADLLCTTIRQLSPAQYYDFQVAAHISGKDWGQWSPKVSAKTEDGGPVHVLTLEKVGATETSLDIQWAVSLAEQARVKGFKILAHPLGDPFRLQQYTVDASTYTYRIEGLEPDTIYNVTVQTRTETGYHRGTSVNMETSDATPPDFDSPPRVIDRRPDSITVEWSASIKPFGVAGYIVEYRLPPRGEWSRFGGLVPHEANLPSYTSKVDKLPPNTDVEIRIIPVGKGNRMGNPSPEARARTECLAPKVPPSGLRAEAPTPNQIRLIWQRPDESTWQCDQIAYEIVYRTDKSPMEQTVRAAAQQTDYTFPSGPHTTWFLKMRTTNRAGSSPLSPEVVVTTLAGAPEKVQDLNLTPLSPNDVKATWNEPAQTHGVIVGYDVSYRLLRLLACPPPAHTSDTWITVYNVPQKEYTLTGLLPYAEYEVKVAARTTELGPAERKTIITEQTAPTAAPRSPQDKYKLERSVTFSWEPPPCEQQHGVITNYQYELFGLDDWAKLDVRIANTSQTQINIDNLTPFTKYRFRVKAFTNQGGGPPTSDLDTMTTEADQPLSPQDLTVVSEGADFIIVSWLPPQPPYGEIDYYLLRYRDNTRREEWVPKELRVGHPSLQCEGVSTVTPRLCHKITGLESGRQYAFQVAAHIRERSLGNWSPEVYGNTIVVLPGAPMSISLIEKTSNSLTISWRPPDDPLGRITTYKVTADSLRPDAGPKGRVHTVDSPTTQLKIEGLEPDTPYNLTVQAGTVMGYGRGISATHSTETGAVPVVSVAPVISGTGPDYLNVEWNGILDVAGVVNGYILEYRSYQEPLWREYGGVIKHDDVKKTYLQKISGLVPDTTYLVRVKVVDKKNKVGEPSPTAEGRTGCEPPTSPPLSIRITAPSSNQVRVTWQSPPTSTWRCSSVTYRIQYLNGTTGSTQHLDFPSSRNDHTFNSAPFTRWTVQMRTDNVAGSSGWTEDIFVSTPEAPPGKVTGVVATPMGPDRAKVHWDIPADPNGVITGYIMTYTLKSKGDCPVAQGQPVVKLVHQEKQLLKDLEPASTYEITIQAKTIDVGPPSDPILFTTEEAVPSGPPTQIAATAVHPTTVTFTWEEPPCEQRNGQIIRYEYLLEGLDQWVKGEPQKGFVSVERVELTKLIPFTRYALKVKAINSKGSGPFSSPLEVVTKPAAPPAPQDVKSEKEYPHAIVISFIAPYPPHGKLDGYRIRYTGTDRINWNEVRKNPDELLCSGELSGKQRLCHHIGELESSKEYAIQVAAHTEAGDWGEWSRALYVKTAESIPGVLVEPLRITDKKSTSLTALWEGFSGKESAEVAGYTLEYSSGDGTQWNQYEDTVPSKGPQGGLHSKTVKGLQPDTWYYFRLKVANKNGKIGEPGPVAKEKTLCGKPTQPPQNIQVSVVDYSGVKVSWDPPMKSTWRCGQASVILKFTNDSASGFKSFSATEPGELVLEAQPGSKWTIQMRTEAVEDGKGEPGDWSDEKRVQVPSVPGNIFVVVTPIDSDKLQVAWDLPEDDRNYPYGVDIQYQLIQRGSCPQSHYPPTTEYNVQDRKTILKNLQPFSKYEITVRPRTPPHLAQTGVTPPKKVEVVRTGEKEPTGPPTNLRVFETQRELLSFTWEPPECDKQNGKITQYEYSFVGLDDWVKGDLRQATTARNRLPLSDLIPGTRYRFKVRAYTSVGPGPWTEPIDVKTEGSELGPPRELHPVVITAKTVTMAWQPPHPLRTKVDRYRIKYSMEERFSEKEDDVNVEDLRCDRVVGARQLTGDTLCYLMKDLRPSKTYIVQVQARSTTGTWGEWSPTVYVTTKDSDGPRPGGSLDLVYAASDKLRVKWEAPESIQGEISYYMVGIAELVSGRSYSPDFTNASRARNYEFTDLKPERSYNVTVEGFAFSQGDRLLLWHISKIFQTLPRDGDGILSWLAAPTNLRLLEKTETSMHLEWDPPEILLPSYQDLVTHYLVTYAPFDPISVTSGIPQQVHVPRPGLKVWLRGLEPETVYNITVQAGTKQGYGEILWGAYSTLPPGQPHVLKLKHRTPTSLHVYWTTVWGTSVGMYKLTAEPLYSVDPFADLNRILAFEVAGTAIEYVIKGLHPQTIYNVTLKPMTADTVAWGAYATLPPGAFVVTNLKVCDETPYSMAFSWTPIDDVNPVYYQVRYAKQGSSSWNELQQRSKHDMRCPGDPCDVLCYALYNLDGGPQQYIVQVRAFVEGSWNRWKTVARLVSDDSPLPMSYPYKRTCCIVPPPYFVENLGEDGTQMLVKIKPVPNATYVQRYYVIVDEREPHGEVNETTLYDKVTAKKLGLQYYITASFDKYTLTEERMFPIGDGKIYGGYINYPLQKGKKYNWAFATIWMVEGKPIVGYLRDTSYVTATYIGGWPWWWLLLLLLLLLLLILLLCLLLWCCTSRYKKRRDQSRILLNGRSSALLGIDDDKKGKGEMAQSLRALENRIDNIRSQLESKVHPASRDGCYDSRDGDRDSDTSSDEFRRRRRREHRSSKGDFEEGYLRGFRDANKLTGTQARRKLEDEYGGMKGDFHSGYIQGLRDAGQTGLTQSMVNLRKPDVGYSAGYMQGFREGDAGLYGDRITNTLIRRVEELYPQEDFRTGYLDGYRDALNNRQTDTTRKSTEKERLAERLSEINERLGTLDRGERGDEIHTTRIYHVYNQLPDSGISTGVGTGAQLAQELEEIQSTSRRSTLRRHYTPGDYLKYPSDTEGSDGLKRYRRTMSASNLGREEYGPVSPPFGGRRDLSSSRVSVNAMNDSSFSRQYKYRSRSDVGAYGGAPPRRYGSQTILEGPRPGPSTPLDRRDALETLQRELSSLSRGSTLSRQQQAGGPAGSPLSPPRAPGYRSADVAARGYSSDTGHGEAWRSKYPTSSAATVKIAGAPGAAAEDSAYEYETYESKTRAQKETTLDATSSGTTSKPGGQQKQPGTALVEAYNLTGLSAEVPALGAGADVEQRQRGDGNWTDELMRIVKEPMENTLDRMKKYNTSMGNIAGAGSDPNSPEGPEAGSRREYVEGSEVYDISYSKEGPR